MHKGQRQPELPYQELRDTGFLAHQSLTDETKIIFDKGE